MLFGPRRTRNPRRRTQTKAIIFTILVIYALYFLFFSDSQSARQLGVSDDKAAYAGSRDRAKQDARERPAVRRRRDMVLASMKRDNTSWLFEEFPEWHKSIYVVDDKNAELTVQTNKGRESMVYLTWVFFNYQHKPLF